MKNMEFFMNSAVESDFEEVEIEGISKFTYPTGHEKAGEIIPWLVRPLSTSEFETIRENNKTIKTSVINGQKVKDVNVDSSGVSYDLMIQSIQYPNFSDPAWLAASKCLDPVDLLKKVLDKPNDFTRISQDVVAANGLGSKDEDLVKEAKN